MHDLEALLLNCAGIKSQELNLAVKHQNSPRNQNHWLVAGPCSVETENQVYAVAKSLESARIDALRGGIWKPRTRPDSFEGIGEEGLVWLVGAANSIGVPAATEVANARHTEMALKAGIKVLWIGARTTVNPFAVQEIANALKGVDVPVWIKNPVNPDLELWLGALERLNKVGITQLGAIHRGFSSYGKSKYRNKPYWEIPIELKRRQPQLPIIVDPSHIGGKRSMIQPLSQQALDLDFDGLMIETHITPDEAWSDAKQQITPDSFLSICDELKWRKPVSSDPQFLNELEELRDTIDSIDNKMISVLAKRMQVARQIGQCKKDNNITILQQDRWDEIFKDRIGKGVEKGLSDHFMMKLYQYIHKESIDQQTRVLNEAEIAKAVNHGLDAQ